MRLTAQLPSGTTATNVQEFTQIENAAAKASSAVRDAMVNFASLCKMVGHPSSGTALPVAASPLPAAVPVGTGAVGATAFDTLGTAVTGPDTGLAAFGEAQDQAITKAEESSGKLGEIFAAAGTDISTSFKDTFRDIFETGDADFKKLGKSIVGTLKGSALKIADAFILNPIGNALSTMVSTAGTNMFGGFAGMLGGGGGTSLFGGVGGFTGGGFGGGGGGGINIFSPGGFMSEGMKDSIFNFGIDALGFSPGFSNTLTNGLSAAPWGALGGFGANMLGLGGGGIAELGLSTLGSIGGGAFGSTIAMLGAAGGPIGAIVGAFLGTALSGLFGSKPQTHKAISPLSFDSSTGVVGLADPTVRRGGNLDLSSSGALESATLLNEILGTFDGGITGLPGRVAFFSKEHDKKGAQIITEFQGGWGVGINQEFSADEQGFKAAVADLTFQTLKAAAKFTGQQTFASARQQISEQTPAAHYLTTPNGRILWRPGTMPGSGALGGGVPSSTEAATDSPGLAQLGLIGASDNVLSAIRKSVATDLAGLTSDIDFAMFVDGLDEMPDAITAAQQAIDAINKTFDEATERADALGFSLESMEAARARELARLTTDFDAGIGQAILGFTDPLQLALDKLAETQEARLKEAEVLGADLVALEQLSGLERQRVMEQFAKQATNSLEQLLIELKSGPGSVLNAPETLANAEGRFSSLVAARRAGEDIPDSDITGAARNLIGASEEFFGGSEQFYQRTDFIISTLDSLVGPVAGFGQNIGAKLAGFLQSGVFGGDSEQAMTSQFLRATKGSKSGGKAQDTELLEKIAEGINNLGPDSPWRVMVDDFNINWKAGNMTDQQQGEAMLSVLNAINKAQEELTDKIDLALSA